MLDTASFLEHLTGLVEQSANPVLVSSANPLSSARFIIAYSGGLDSHVLLHLMQAAGLNCQAVYIDHGLQDASQSWAEHCLTVCQQLSIPFQSITVNAKAAKGESPEASARGARYKALAALMQSGDILLTAQHQQDQAETFILQLIRTAGPAGLSAMPAIKAFAQGYHLRPLLNVTRAELASYAQQHQLSWIEDPSNTDQRYDRNFLRHSVIPVLQQRWPSFNQTLSNVSLLQAEASELMNDLAAMDAQNMVDGATLDIAQLLQVSLPRQKNCIRYWLQQLDLDVPTAKRLHEILGPVVSAAGDKSPVVSWAQTEIRRFQGKLYAMPCLQPFDAKQVMAWDGRQTCELTALGKQLGLITSEKGLAKSILEQPLSIRFRNGGEKIKPLGRAHTMDLKKLMQEAAVPPWLRSRTPLLFIDEQLIAVADYWVSDDYKNPSNEAGLQLVSQTI